MFFLGPFSGPGAVRNGPGEKLPLGKSSLSPRRRRRRTGVNSLPAVSSEILEK